MLSKTKMNNLQRDKGLSCMNRKNATYQKKNTT